MQFFDNLFLGIKTYGSALTFIRKHKLWHFFFFPLLIGLFLVVVAYMGIQVIVDEFNAWNDGWLDVDANADDWWNIGKSSLGVVLGFVAKYGLILLYFTINKYLVLIVMSPVLALLSEKVDKIVTGTDYPFDGDQFFRDVLRGIWISLRNMFLEFGVIILVSIFSLFLPFISPFTAIFIMLVEFYFYGFALMDYTNERRRLKVKDSVRFIKSNRGIAIGNGGMFSLLFFVPVLGAMVAPVLGTVAATLAIYKKEGNY